MTFRDFNGDRLSALGLGCMRLPTKEGKIDRPVLADMVKTALQKGINYFDTAYMYHNGESESAVGEALSAYPRDSYYLASKFPGFCRENVVNHTEIFEEQLRRCRTNYFDFYLFHSLTDRNIDWYLDPELGLIEYLREQKKQGRIRHLGVSVHCTQEQLERFMEAYGDDIEFCQIQLNWMDWEYQDAKRKVEYLNSLGKGIWVMEPLRGGSLCNLNEDTVRRLAERDSNRSLPDWGFDFVRSVPGVKMILSGMSNPGQLAQNIAIFEREPALNDNDFSFLVEEAKRMLSERQVPCTACRYCVTGCPAGLEIPKLLSIYNRYAYLGGKISNTELDQLGPEHGPSSCIGCRACEEVCPQGIKISEVMTAMTERL